MMAGRPQKYTSLDQIRQAQRESAMKWYNKPENREKRKQSMRDYYRRMKEQKAKKEAE